MPVNWKDYPPNWKLIAFAKKESVGWICEKCGKQCRRPGEPFDTHKRTLTVSHKDHNPMNIANENLQAFCAPCHLRYDARHHAETRKKIRRKLMSDMQEEFRGAFDKIMSDVKDGMDIENKKDKPVYKDFDDEEIPEDFIFDKCRLRRNGKLQYLETPDGHKFAIKCPSTGRWCKGNMEGVFGCVGCKHYDDWLTTETPSFKKNDQGKLQWSLMPFEQFEEVVRVLMKGAKKYGKDNWKNCDDINRYKDALMRHVVSYNKGERNDPEDNLPHLAHAICNCLFLMYFNSVEDENFKRYLQIKGLTESEDVCQKK